MSIGRPGPSLTPRVPPATRNSGFDVVALFADPERAAEAAKLATDVKAAIEQNERLIEQCRAAEEAARAAEVKALDQQREARTIAENAQAEMDRQRALLDEENRKTAHAKADLEAEKREHARMVEEYDEALTARETRIAEDDRKVSDKVEALKKERSEVEALREDGYIREQRVDVLLAKLSATFGAEAVAHMLETIAITPKEKVDEPVPVSEQDRGGDPMVARHGEGGERGAVGAPEVGGERGHGGPDDLDANPGQRLDAGVASGEVGQG